MANTMKAIQVPAAGAEFELVSRAIPEPKPNEILIHVKSCGICHGDTIAKDGGHFPGLTWPRIPGHEVVGTVHALGSPDLRWKVGELVGVGWPGGHCGTCAFCMAGEFVACERGLVTGVTIDGGYAEYMVARTDAVVALPDAFDVTVDAPLLCAGRTTFGALQSSNLKGGDTVAVLGLGGLGHLAVQYASKLGYRVVAISRGSEKRSLAIRLGAHQYIDTSSTDAVKALQGIGGANVILATAPNAKTVSALVAGLARGGEMVIVSGIGEPLVIPGFLLLRGNLKVRGSVEGTIAPTIRFSHLCGVKPMVELFSLEQAALGYRKMLDGTVHFRSVLTMH
jgi:D-arabinose 1-dehydrogenase-like Zn-dependent alcohol dehydrogenase